MSWLQQLVLEGHGVELRPLQRADRDALVAAAADGELWKLWYTSVPGPETVDSYLDFALSEMELGRSLAFVVVQKSTGDVIGSTRYCNVEAAHRRLEIGYTLYGKSHQRTSVNTACKLLLLSHAFEQLDAIAVEFRTHFLNHGSRRAIERLGAKLDGVMRNHRIEPDGSFRDSAVYSIVRDEWPAVKNGLIAKLR